MNNQNNFKFKNKTLKFIHIPKTGGTSIENAAFSHNLKWGRFDKSLTHNYHQPQKTKDYSFCVMRNPFDKFISQFYHDNQVKNYNAKNLNHYIEKKIPEIKNNENINDFHFLPQHYYYDTCNIVISYDNLQKNLNQLMRLFKLPLLTLDKLPGGKIQQRKRNSVVFKRLTTDDINKKNKDELRKFYKLDFDLYKKVKDQDIIIK